MRVPGEATLAAYVIVANGKLDVPGLLSEPVVALTYVVVVPEGTSCRYKLRNPNAIMCIARNKRETELYW